MTAVLCTAAVGPHLELLDVAERTLERYAEAHDMDLVVGREPIQTERPPSWSKVVLLRDLLGDYDTVIWVDADACFVRYDRNILDDAPPSQPLWMVAHAMPGLGHTLPNCGVLVAHRCSWLTLFLAEVWDQTQFIDHPWWEQAAILHLLGWEIEPPGGYAKPGRDIGRCGWLGTEWNSMRYDPHPEPIVRHYTGAPLHVRLCEMREDVTCAV